MATHAELLAPSEIHGLYIYYRKRFETLAELELPVAWTPWIELEDNI